MASAEAEFELQSTTNRPDWRPTILAVAMWSGTWLATLGQAWILATGGAVAATILGFAIWRSRWFAAAVALVLLASFVVAGARVQASLFSPVAEVARQRGSARAELRIGPGRMVPSARGQTWIAEAVIERLIVGRQEWRSGAKVKLSATGELVEGWAELPVGAVVAAPVSLSPAAAQEESVAWVRPRASPTLVAEPGFLDRQVSRIRSGLRASVEGLPPAPRSLVPALVLGDTGPMAPEVTQDFRQTGLTHLTAVSGANLTLMLAALLTAAAWLRATGWWLRLVAVAGTAGFVLLCRSEPSVLRAAAMGLVGLAALGWGTGRGGMRALSWAIFGLLLIDPWLSRSVGFVLSVCASAGIILWARRWAEQLAWLPRWLAESITVPVAAQLATQPVVTAISGQVSLVGVLANLLAGPLVGPSTVLGFLAAGVAVISVPAAAVPGWLAGGFAQGLCWIAAAGAALPGASIGWPATGSALLLLAGLCLALVLGLPHLWQRPRALAAIAVILVGILVRPINQPGWPPPDWQVVSCDVGQGDATAIAAGPGRAILVDTGPDPDAVDRCLRELGITEVPWLVLSHLHADHIGGLAGVSRGRRVDRLLFSGITEPAAGWRAVQQGLPGVPVLTGSPGLVVASSGTEVAVLAHRQLSHPSAGDDGDSAAVNDASLVVRAKTASLRVLLAGDLEESGQASALSAREDLGADVLLVPHHGSAHQDPAFLRQVAPQVALISVGEGNDYGHPARQTLAAIESIGISSYRTDQRGSVAITAGSTGLMVTTQRGP